MDGTKRKVVKIHPIFDIPLNCQHPSQIEMEMMEILRDAGIPIKGTFHFNGVKEGTLSRYDTRYPPYITFVWEKECVITDKEKT